MSTGRQDCAIALAIGNARRIEQIRNFIVFNYLQLGRIVLAYCFGRVSCRAGRTDTDLLRS